MTLDTSSTDERLRSLYEFWRSRQGETAVPLRSCFLPEEFAPWMGHISILGVENDPRRYRLRLVGTKIVEYDGTDFTGRYLDEVLEGPARDVVLRQIDHCVDTRKAVALRYRTRAFFHGFEAGIDKLLLPFSRDGETVSYVFACLYASFSGAAVAERPTIQYYEAEGNTVAFDPELL